MKIFLLFTDHAWLDVELLASVMVLYFSGMPVHIPCDVMLSSVSTTVPLALVNNIKYCKHADYYCKPLEKQNIVAALR